jgi:hypothetical protein
MTALLLRAMAAAILFPSPAALAATVAAPTWLAHVLPKPCPAGSATGVDEDTYEGKRTFTVMPCDRAPDIGNEHVLYSEDGKVICEFGGIGGSVTSGKCDPDKIVLVRTLSRPRLPRP